MPKALPLEDGARPQPSAASMICCPQEDSGSRIPLRGKEAQHRGPRCGGNRILGSNRGARPLPLDDVEGASPAGHARRAVPRHAAPGVQHHQRCRDHARRVCRAHGQRFSLQHCRWQLESFDISVMGCQSHAMVDAVLTARVWVCTSSDGSGCPSCQPCPLAPGHMRLAQCSSNRLLGTWQLHGCQNSSPSIAPWFSYTTWACQQFICCKASSRLLPLPTDMVDSTQSSQGLSEEQALRMQEVQGRRLHRDGQGTQAGAGIDALLSERLGGGKVVHAARDTSPCAQRPVGAPLQVHASRSSDTQ